MLLANLQFIFQTHNIKQSALCFPGTKSFVHKLNFHHKSQKFSLWTKLFEIGMKLLDKIDLQFAVYRRLQILSRNHTFVPMTEKEILTQFGLRLAQLRSAAGLSQEALAHKSSLNRTFVGELERGEKCPSLITLVKLSEALAVPASQLLNHKPSLVSTKKS